MTLVNVHPNNRRRNQRRVIENPLFDTFFKDLLKSDFSGSKNTASTQSRPAANVIEDKDGYRIELAVPGLSKKDININVEKDLLTIKANKEAEQKEDEKFTRKEFAYNEFSRSFRLPETIDLGNIKANFKNGILIISLAKKEEAKELPPRVIEIK
jgi:HSP20 family protein